MRSFRTVRRQMWKVIGVALFLSFATAAPTVANITWDPPPGVRYGSQPRVCDFLGTSATGGICPGGANGGQFLNGSPTMAFSNDGATNYVYAGAVGDRGAGNEDQVLVPYGGAASLPYSAAKDCSIGGSGGALPGYNPGTLRSVSGATAAANIATYTTTASHTFFPGDKVVVAGMPVGGYNGTWTVIDSPTTTTFRANIGSTPGASGGGGTAARDAYCGTFYFARASATRSAISTQAVTAASYSSGPKTVTYTTGAAHGLVAGGTVNVFQANPSEYNYSGPILSNTATTITVDYGGHNLGNPGAYVGSANLFKSTWAWDGGGGQYGTNPFPISQVDTQIQASGLAAAGAYVYAMWTTSVGYYSEQCQPDPKVLYVRINSNYGAANAWGPPIRLSPTNRLSGYPWINAQGNNVYIAYTDQQTGDIKVLSSSNNGSSFTGRTVGNTRAIYDDTVMPGAPQCTGSPTAQWTPYPTIEGYEGFPAIAGNGFQAGVAWTKNNGGAAAAKISTDNGVTWPMGAGPQYGLSCATTPSLCTMHLTANGTKGALPSAAGCPSSATYTTGACGTNTLSADADSQGTAATGRVAFGFVDDITNAAAGPSGVYMRMYLGTGGWQPKRLVGCFDSAWTGCGGATGMAATYDDGYATSLSLYGTTGVGIAWTACPVAAGDPCDGGSGNVAAAPEMLWKQSGDNGVTLHDGCTTGVPCGKYRQVANNNWNNESGGTNALNSLYNEYSDVGWDIPGDSATGCTQQGASNPPGLPSVGCQRYVYFVGRDSYYQYYRTYIDIGTQT